MLVRAIRLFSVGHTKGFVAAASRIKESTRAEQKLVCIRKEDERSIRGSKIARSNVGRSPVFIHDFARAMLTPYVLSLSLFLYVPPAHPPLSPLPLPLPLPSLPSLLPLSHATLYPVSLPVLPPHHVQGRIAARKCCCLLSRENEQEL